MKMKCPDCGIEYFSLSAEQNVSLLMKSDSNINLSMVVEPCPREGCGGGATSNMTPDSFIFSEHMAAFRTGPNPRDRLNKIERIADEVRRLAERASKSDVSHTDILLEVAGLSPELANKLGVAKLDRRLLIFALFMFYNIIAAGVTTAFSKAIEIAIERVVEDDASAPREDRRPADQEEERQGLPSDEDLSSPQMHLTGVDRQLSKRAARRARGKGRSFRPV